MGLSTRAELSKRVETVYVLLSRGYSNSEIVQFCEEKYDVRKSTAHKYIKRATDRITSDNQATIQTARAEATLRYKTLFRKLYDTGNFTGAIKAQERIDKINGIEEIKETINLSITKETGDKLKSIFEED